MVTDYYMEKIYKSLSKAIEEGEGDKLFLYLSNSYGYRPVLKPKIQLGKYQNSNAIIVEGVTPEGENVWMLLTHDELGGDVRETDSEDYNTII